IRDVRDGTIEIAVLVPISVKKTVDVVHAGKADRARDDVGMPRCEVRCVIRAEARAVHGEIATLRAIENVRHHLIAQIRVVLHVTRGAHRRMNRLVVPALVVHRVDERELNLAVIDFIGERCRDVHVIVFGEIARRRWKNHHRPAELSEPEKLHLFAEGGRPPLAVFAVHVVALLTIGCAPCAKNESAFYSEWKTRFRGRSSIRSTLVDSTSRQHQSKFPISKTTAFSNTTSSSTASVTKFRSIARCSNAPPRQVCASSTIRSGGQPTTNSSTTSSQKR